MLRLFIAVNLPKDALEACAAEARRVERALGAAARGVRFARPEGLHFTLKFLGLTPEDQVDSIRAGLEAAAAESAPFPLALRGLEAFPNARRPRVVYVSVSEGAGPMKALAEAVERHLAPLGFPTEQRAFTPHVTLARVKEPKLAARVGAAVSSLPPLDVCRTLVASVCLMRSELSPGGSRYTELARLALGHDRS